MPRNTAMVDAIRAIAFREARDSGLADIITDEWVSQKLRRSKLWVRNNWEKTYDDVIQGNIWPPGLYKPEEILGGWTNASGRQPNTSRQSPDVPHAMGRRMPVLPTSGMEIQSLEELPENDQPMPFIEDAGHGRFKISDRARKVLEGNDKSVCIVAIAGKYRTGKSFLMNRLYGRNSGFPLGGTIQAQTKGIWMWQRSHPVDPSRTLILIDTEGLFDVEKGDQTHDIQVFTLAILLSSCMVFNVQSSIDDAMIHQLHLVSQLTEHIRTKNAIEENGQEFSKYFPTFIMVIRDFFLELKINGSSCSADEYLEHALKLKPGHSQETKNYNTPRECVKEFFTRRKCFVMPKPVDDDSQIRELEKVREKDLKPEFLEKADCAVKTILQEAVPFKVDEETITGQRFVELASLYVEAMNSGHIPCIESAVAMLRKVECGKAKSEALNLYIIHMIETASSKMPMEIEALSHIHQAAMETAAEIFRKKALFDEEGDFVKEFLDEIKGMYQEFIIQNEDESTHICQNYLSKVFSEIDNKIGRSYYNKEGGYEEYKEDCDLAATMYHSYPDKGPMVQAVFTKFMKQRENEGYTILYADKALSEKARELKMAEAEREHQELQALAQKERNEALRQQLEDEQVNNKRILAQVREDMENRIQEQQANHEKLMREKQQALEQLRKEGSQKAAKLESDLQSLRRDKQKMQDNQNAMREEMRRHEESNNNLLRELKQLKDSNANNQQKLQQMQAAAQPPPRKKKGKCVVM